MCIRDRLEVEIFDDYILPNEVVEAGEFDANYFQHIPYLDSFNEEKGTHLVNAGGIHYEPFGIYPGTKDSLDDIEDGDTIAVPNDTTNEARALLLLQDNGIITLKEGVGPVSYTHLDVYKRQPWRNTGGYWAICRRISGIIPALQGLIFWFIWAFSRE